MPLTFHVPMVPHTRPTAAFTHCAFTTKARLLPQLLKHAFPDCTVATYGVTGDLVAYADTHVGVMSPIEWGHFFAKAHADKTAFAGNAAHVDHPGYVLFNRNLADQWAGEVCDGDVVCFPFGHAHGQAWAALAPTLRERVIPIETGIGYPTPFLPYRIYESRAWMHYVAGKTGIEGSDYHFVAPHYYDLGEWPVPSTHQARNKIVFMGRLGAIKGLDVLRAVADAMPECEFVMYGQGDPSHWEGRNLRYGGVLVGDERREALAEAQVVLCPTRYIEPFCQTHVEALLCGAPVVASPFGVFPEHASGCPGITIARTLPQWVTAVEERVFTSWRTRDAIARDARHMFGIPTVASLYRDAITQCLQVLEPSGWYGQHAHILHR
jgi:glycosyltransferase involved in cell wall biosynthesis